MAKLDPFRGVQDSRPCSSPTYKANQGAAPSQKIDGMNGGVETRPKSSISANETKIKGKGATSSGGGGGSRRY